MLARVARIGSPASFALALLLFALPFLSVSCDAPGGYGRVGPGGTTTYSGVDLAIGSAPSVDGTLRAPAEQESDELDPQPLLVLALVAVAAALIVELATRRALTASALGVAAIVALIIGLLVARSSLVDRVEAQATSPNTSGKSPADYVHVGAGFWLVLFVTAVGSGLCALEHRWRVRRGSA